MKSKFQFAGKSSDEFYLTVEKLPAIVAPEKKYTTISVPGRNGDLHVEENAFQNYVQSYECYLHAPDHTAVEVAHAIKAWLLGSSGQQILKDTYDPNHFRKAIFLGPLNIERLLNEYGRCTISFTCAPQSFLCGGDQKIELWAAGVLHNPTAFPALPLIRVYGIGDGNCAGAITVGNTTVRLDNIWDGLTLDCETQNAYRQLGEGAPENLNSVIYAPEFPVLAPGDNAVSWEGEIDYIEIVPRWWTI